VTSALDTDGPLGEAQGGAQPDSRTEFWADLYAVCPPRTEVVPVGDLNLSASIWDASDRPGASPRGPDVLLVHGGAEQRSWWDHLVPLLRGGGRIVAFDFTGHGDSSGRETYALETWADEVGSVASHLLRPRPALVGHSMGGLVASLASQVAPRAYAGVMALDSPTQRTTDGHAVRREKIAARPVRTHRTLEDALATFKTYPQVPTAPAALMDHISRAAFEPAQGGWRRKFDPLVYNRPQAPDDFVRAAPVPTTWLRTENGFIDDEMAHRITAALGPLGEMIFVPAAGHHLTLEHPVATAWLVSEFLQRLELAAADRPSA
jgi:pimeloyl-ACP methyl ester carboxylesterase